MSSDKTIKTEQSDSGELMSDYPIMLPCSPSNFADFISGLLGRPQTLEKVFTGPFEVTSRDVQNTFHLVDQRVHQQNDASLIQFTVRIVYSDDSSVLLNSLEDFDAYTEVEPLTSVAAHLSWTYLIKFMDKAAPEKQVIEMSIVSSDSVLSVLSRENKIHAIRHFEPFFSSSILLRISHTARTWGIDIQNILTGHIKTLMKEDHKLKQIIYKHSGLIAFICSALFYLSVIGGAYLSTEKIVEKQRILASSILKSNASSTEAALNKLNYLIESGVKGIWPRFTLSLGFFLLLAFVIAVLIAIWVENMADNTPRSFVLLSKQAEEKKTKFLKKRQRKWFFFICAVLSNVITGIAANILFRIFFSQWP